MKQHPEFTDYCITKSGKVWSKRSKRFLVPYINRKERGHLKIGLQKNRVRYRKFVHGLVLETYVGFRPKGMECRHLDGNPKNNKLKNLKWGTRLENEADRTRHGRRDCRGERGTNVKLNSLQVRIIRRLLEFNILRQREIAELFNISRRAISHIKCKQSWKCI